MMNKLQLHGFNNLTKTLSFNIYDICYARTQQHRQEYFNYIDNTYNARRLTDILSKVTDILDANILNIAYQDYEPQGASVTILISEAIVGHLDKSHIAVHTYPESHPDNGISTFRVDIDVSTCGVISPLKSLNYLISEFDSDIVTMDYKVRGFTRAVCGKKIYIDQEIKSIQDFICADIGSKYQTLDVNLLPENIFHTRMLLKEFNLDDYLFGTGSDDFSAAELAMVSDCLRKEMLDIFHSGNFFEAKDNTKYNMQLWSLLEHSDA